MRAPLVLAGASAVLAIVLYKFRRRIEIQIPPTMSAVVAMNGKCALRADQPTPTPKPDEVLIRVKSTAINRLDVLQRLGKAPVPKGVTEVLGLECAGVVVAAGSQVKGFYVNDEVLALVPGGGYAQYVAVHHATVMHKPSNMPWDDAGSIPEAWLTAYKLLHVVGRVAKGDRVVVHAAASGVGVAAIQLSNAAGASAFVTVGSQEKLDLCVARLGAAAGAVRHDGPWIDALKASDPMKGAADLILDPVASNYAEQNLEALAVDGRWVLYSLLSGPGLPEPVAKGFLGSLAKKRISLLATTLRARPIAFKTDLVKRFSRDVLPRIGSSGAFEHLIDKRFTGLDQAQAAHEYMETNANMGKIVLTVE